MTMKPPGVDAQRAVIPSRILGLVPSLVLAGVVLGAWGSPVRGLQDVVSVRVSTGDGYLDPSLTVVGSQGFAAIPVQELTRLGWSVAPSEEGAVAHWRRGNLAVDLRAGTPFLSWGGEAVQLAEAPYRVAGSLYVPLQLVIDVFPWKLPDAFRYDPDTRILTLVPRSGPDRGSEPLKVVVIDPGHGGRDTGALGRGGTREKDVALVIGKALARALEDESDLMVFLTRETDTLIPLWKRGELATEWKGDRPGIFVSIHANALPGPGATRGFETYFLSEARTEHERRVTALENAAQELEVQEDGTPEGSDLTFILTELRNLDHQHWSALLAELVQEKMSQVHPGPNRGVKQGPLAVITNALMPAVLVEVGFLTHGEEEELLNQGIFQENTARALASAIREFFRRYSGPTGFSNGRPGIP